MKVSGFSFVRNAIIFDYPFLESIRSILPLCDEFIVAVGRSDDETLLRLEKLDDPKIKIVQTNWNDAIRTGGTVLAEQTNIALCRVTGDWAFYLQADEVVHEKDSPLIRNAMESHVRDSSVEGLLFDYLHFYGSYDYIGQSRRWYRREIRIVRNGIGVQSWGDAQGFRIGSRKLKVKRIHAPVYHYGWVKPPRIQQLKQQHFNKLWHPDEWVERNVSAVEEYDYSRGGRLVRFTGNHPKVMEHRVAAQDWKFSYDPSRIEQSITESSLDWIEQKTGYRVAEYQNYEII
jgi:glycosyltransferase involved in cell wall biosynthesis